MEGSTPSLLRQHLAVQGLPPPADVPRELVDGIEAAAFHETLGEAQGHRRVVGPGARGEVEGTAADLTLSPEEEAALANSFPRGPPRRGVPVL